jgi:alpha/beta superfamily hydrolase
MDGLQAATFPSAGSSAISLEGILHTVDDEGPWPAAVVCHPHPLGGGNMYNAVVSALARSLAARGVMALRFNFRGVGRSGGQHDYGRGERADVRGALDWLLAQPGVDAQRVSLVGYSFGAWVGLAQAQVEARVSAVAAVGLTAWHYDAEFARTHSIPDLGTERWQAEPDFLRSFNRPKLLVTGEFDSFAPPHLLGKLADRLPPPKALHVVRGTDHFLLGREQEVGSLVAGFIAGL